MCLKLKWLTSKATYNGADLTHDFGGTVGEVNIKRCYSLNNLIATLFNITKQNSSQSSKLSNRIGAGTGSENSPGDVLYNGNITLVANTFHTVENLTGGVYSLPSSANDGDIIELLVNPNGTTTLSGNIYTSFSGSSSISLSLGLYKMIYNSTLSMWIVEKIS